MAYAFKRTLTVDHTQCGSSDSTNFPILFSFTDTTMKLVGNGGHINNTTTSNGQTVCADLAFYSDSALTTKLNWEIEFYDGTAGTVIAWVQVATLSHTADTVFYMAYDDASVTTFQGNVNGTWPSSAVGVWHLPNGSSLSGNDSTSNANHLINNGATATSGQIDGGAHFVAASSQYLANASITNGPTIAGPLTMSLWLQSTQMGSRSIAFALVKDDTNAAGSADSIETSSLANAFDLNSWGNTILSQMTGTQVANTWYLVHWAIDASGHSTGYLNGSNIASLTNFQTQAGTVGVVRIGSLNSAFPSPYWDGLIDEARLYNTNLSADWITAEYNNQKTSSTFLTVGSETPISSAFTTGRSYFL